MVGACGVYYTSYASSASAGIAVTLGELAYRPLQGACGYSAGINELSSLTAWLCPLVGGVASVAAGCVAS